MPISSKAEAEAKLDDVEIRIAAATKAAGYSTEDVTVSLPQLEPLQKERAHWLRVIQQFEARAAGATGDSRVKFPRFG